MDPTILRDMPRAALQKLAKENRIKANLKSDQIIQLLLERNTTNLPLSRTKSVASPKGANHASPRSRAHPFAAAKNKVRVSVAPSDNSRKSSEPIELPPYADASSQAEDVRHRAPSAETIDIYATPESSISGTPEPEADPRLLERTVEMIADVDRIDKRTLQKIIELRTVAAKLRGKARDLQGLLRAERAMRVRMEDYLAHWTRTNPKWTYEEVWSGQIRVRNMYEALEISTSDEEDPATQDINHLGEASGLADQGAVTFTLPQHQKPEQGRGASTTFQLKTSSNVGAASEIAPSIETGTRTDTIHKRKRRREEDDAQDESRYSPRARSEVPEELTRDPDPSHLSASTRLLDNVKGGSKDGAASSKALAPTVPGQRMRVTRQTAKETTGV